MSNNLTNIKQKISNKELVIGTHMGIGEPTISEILCNCGFDLIWVDGEHAAIDRKDINLLIMAISSKGVAPFVRITWNDPAIVKPVLEMGPAAIVFPFIKTAEEAKLAVSSCRYPPYGIRGFGPYRAINYRAMDVGEYLKMSETDPWIILQIEHIDGVNNLEEIIKVSGVDSIVVGTNDLSGSIGLLGQPRHPKVLGLLDRIANICNEANFPFGISMGWYLEDDIEDWLRRGVSWMVLGGDVQFLFRSGCNTFDLIKKRSKDYK
ncbi:MAG: 4-hydroxy-3-methylbut-2-en-1-yl diphosphate synthase [Actinobacteria bacterium]|nr:4-hydroxy-3-methylbut-2-en-1-yl diphosphate synthase [Actinomycetota bacterium]